MRELQIAIFSFGMCIQYRLTMYYRQKFSTQYVTYVKIPSLRQKFANNNFSLVQETFSCLCLDDFITNMMVFSVMRNTDCVLQEMMI